MTRRGRPATGPAKERLRLREAARAIVRAGLKAADPGRLVKRQLSVRHGVLHVAGLRHRLGRGRVVLVAAGKAATTMTAAAEAALGRHLDEGLAVDVQATARPIRRSRILLARHPLPDERGVRAAREVEALVGGLDRSDLLIVLLSGGASALLPAPVDGISLEDKAAATSLLMHAGAGIHELNAVRKHLSRLKGGGLARLAAPARVVTLVLSDVVGDELSTIGSGPTVPDPTCYADAVAILRGRGVWKRLPAAVRRHLEAGLRGERPETPKARDAFFARVATRIVGSNRLSVEAAARQARALGFDTRVLTTRLEGEAREASRVLVSLLRECVATGRPARLPACLLAGGETTVTVRGGGRGGRNQELATAAAEPLSRFPSPAVLVSFATDGIDGVSDAAGGCVDDTTLAHARSLGLAPPDAFLAESDSFAFLGPAGGLVRTGPTGTNVVDLVVLLAGRG